MEINKGYAGGINFGLKKANETGFDYFLIMNNDTLIDENAIKELVKTSEKHQGKAIVSGKVYNYDEKTLTIYRVLMWVKKVFLIINPPLKTEEKKISGSTIKKLNWQCQMI